MQPTDKTTMPGYLQEMNRRLTDRERANPIARASFHDGTRTRGAIGKYTHPDASEDYGAIFYDASGNELLRVDDTSTTLTTALVIADTTDSTKHTVFDTSALTTGVVRTITMPDEDVTLGGSGGMLASTYDPTAVAGDAFARANHAGTQLASTISDFDTEVSNNSSVTANTAKVTNATHTGDVTGATALTIASTAVTGQTLVTADAADYVLVSDTSDSGNLKKSLVSDFGAQTAADISDFDTEVSNNSSVTANTAKVTNATHTGDVTGATALTIASTAVTGQTLVTADAADYVLVSDTSDSGNLKKSLVSDFGAQTAADISDFDTEVSNNSSVTANTAKVTNATHTGDVTGATALTIASTAVTGQTLVTADAADYVLVSDTSDSGNLKKSLVSDFGAGGGGEVHTSLDAGLPSLIGGSLDWGHLLPGYTSTDLGNVGFTMLANDIYWFPFVAPVDMRINGVLTAFASGAAAGVTQRLAVVEYDHATHNPGTRIGSAYVYVASDTNVITGLTWDLTAGVEYAFAMAHSAERQVRAARTEVHTPGMTWRDLTTGDWDCLNYIQSTTGGGAIGSNDTDPTVADATYNYVYHPFLIRTETL